MNFETLKPIALTLTTPVGLVLAAFGITADEQDVQNVLLAIATILGIIGTIWGPSVKALTKFKDEAK
jgi:uncharacterized membrane protein